jgi:hypothetical protein
MFGVLCFGDVDGFIAKYNISAYQSGNISELDIRLFYDLSDSAVKYAVLLADDDEAGAEIRDYLSHKYEKLNILEFKRYNFESLRALRILQEHYN